MGTILFRTWNRAFFLVLRWNLPVALVCVLGSGCGTDPGSGGPNPVFLAKSLYSDWSPTSGSVTLDLTEGEIGPCTVYWRYGSGAICLGVASISGTQTSGTLSVTNSTYISGGGGDPGCASWIGSYSFAKTGTTLELCMTGGGCYGYD